MFTKVLGGSERLELQKIIQKFQKNVSITNISKNFLNKLLKTKSGKVFQLFALWKSIPDVKLTKKKKKAIKFESQLNKFAGKLLKITY
jgi:amino acid permease